MAWTVNWMYMILMTSLTGGVFTLIWYGVSRALERMGYLNITYKMLKVILIFWYCPFMYYLLLYMDRYTAKWGGWNDGVSLPVIIACVQRHRRSGSIMK